MPYSGKMYKLDDDDDDDDDGLSSSLFKNKSHNVNLEKE
jgi:hypothetical protein